MKNIKVHRDSGVANLAEITEFQRIIGFSLPRSYVNLLAQHNALYPLEPDFDYIDVSTGSIESRDITFLGFGSEAPDESNIYYAQGQDVYGHDGVIVFGSSAGGDFICFDYRSNLLSDEPKVVLMFHDALDENGKLLINPIANSFEDFIELLYKLHPVAR